MNMRSKTPIRIVTGSLGAGKTDLLLDCVSMRHSSLTVIVSDYGETSIDASLLGNFRVSNFGVAASCVCCDGNDGIINALLTLKQNKAALTPIIIEMSGLAEPSMLLTAMFANNAIVEAFEVECIVCCIDVTSAYVSRGPNSVYVDQIRCADVICFTKQDLCIGNELKVLDGRVRNLNPSAQVVDRDNTLLLLSALESETLHQTKQKTFRCVEMLHTDSKFDNVVIDWPAPILASGLSDWLFALSAILGDQIIRMKGITKRISDPSVSFDIVNGILFPVRSLGREDDLLNPGGVAVLIGNGLDREAIQEAFKFATGSRTPKISSLTMPPGVR